MNSHKEMPHMPWL